MPMSRDHDLIARQSVGIQEGVCIRVKEDNRIVTAAHRLAVYFTEDANLPARFRKSFSSSQSQKIKKNTEIEKRFRANVMAWKTMIETMFAKINNRQAWRFIDLSPEIHPNVRDLTDCMDFCDFMDYLILRRDKEICSADELGGLALLSTAFQREIENQIKTFKDSNTSTPADLGDAG